MAKILIVEDTADTRNLIRIKLTKAGHQVLLAEDGEVGLKMALAESPQLVVLDVMLPKLDGYSVARRLRQTAQTRNIAILMLTAKSEIADKVTGFEAGADDYLTKPFDPSELELRVRTLLMRVAPLTTEAAVRQGHLVSVFSLRGGVGKTSLAVNLAVTLAQLSNQSVPLLDLSLQNGHAAIFLGLRPKATLEHLVDHWKEYADADSLKEFFVEKDKQVRVLAPPAQPAGAERITAEMLKHLLKLIRADSPITVADLSSKLDDQMLAALDASDLILLLLTPEVASVHTTVETLDTFRALDYPKEKIKVVVNNLFARRALTVAQIESALSVPVALVIPHDADFFVHAINAGEPYVLLNPNGAATRVIQDFAYKLCRPDSNAQPGESLSPLAKSVQARLKTH